MTGDTPKLDRADWGRFSATNRDRCTVCGERAAVNVTLRADEKTTTDRGTGKGIVKQILPFCHEHGILRYGDALRKLQGTA